LQIGNERLINKRVRSAQSRWYLLHFRSSFKTTNTNHIFPPGQIDLLRGSISRIKASLLNVSYNLPSPFFKKEGNFYHLIMSLPFLSPSPDLPPQEGGTTIFPSSLEVASGDSPRRGEAKGEGDHLCLRYLTSIKLRSLVISVANLNFGRNGDAYI
jgi:hypothetical protein